MTAVQRAKRNLAQLSELGPVGASIGRVFRERVPSRGLRIDTRGLAPSIKSQLLFGTYESAEVRAVQRYLRSDLDVIELGASIGVLSCHIRRKLRPERRLYCVETDASAAKMIRVNLELNGLNHNATVIHAALAYGDVETQFSRGETNLCGRIAEQSIDASLVVSTVTLETLVRDFSIRDYALVCDIEGSEWEMIANDTAALGSCAQIIMEVHSKTNTDHTARGDEMIDILCNLGGFLVRSRYGNIVVFEK